MKIFKWILMLLAVAVIGFCAFFVWTQYLPSSSNVETQEIMQSTTTSFTFGDIGELATEAYYYTRVQTYDNSKTMNGFVIPFTKSSVIYSYDGIIKAGVDFDKISAEKDDILKTITIYICLT